MPRRREQRLDKALAVRISGLDYDGHPFEQTARVVDISRRGARLDGVFCLRSPGAVIEVRYGRKRARYGVIWLDASRGQAGICCAEPDKCIWDVPLPPPQAVDYPPLSSPPAEAAENAKPAAAPQARRHPRFHCTAAVTVRAAAFSRPIWGRVTDIGLGGCFVEAGSPLEPHTQVDLLISGLEGRPTGVVRFTLRGRGMGIMFRGLSDEVRRNLERFLAGFSPRNKLPAEAWND